jgi:dCTP deaminase
LEFIVGVLSDRQIEAEKIISNGFFKREYAKQTNVISAGLGSYGYDCRIGYKFKVFKAYPPVVIDPKNFNEACFEHVDLTPHQHDWTSDGFCYYCGGTIYEGPDQIAEGSSCVRRENNPPNFIEIPPHSFILGESIEEFNIPRDAVCIVLGKSTYARCGLIVNVTPGEPEWKGKWTIEISNTTPLPAKVYCGEGVMQCLFFRSDERRALLQQTIDLLIDKMHAAGGMLTSVSSAVTSLWSRLNRLGIGSCQTSYADKKGKYQNATGIDVPKVINDLEEVPLGEDPKVEKATDVVKIRPTTPEWAKDSPTSIS